MNEINRQQLRDDVHINCAKQYARLSKDKNTQVGCVIIAKDNTPVSHGYNGTIAGFPDSQIPHSREHESLRYLENGKWKEFTANKYPFMSHAESNALYYADKSKLDGATMYILGFPCIDCAKQIARSGIARVVIESPKNVDTDSMLADAEFHEAKYLFALKNIKLCIDGNEVVLWIPVV